MSDPEQPCIEQPGVTCPDIDDLLSLIDGVFDELKDCKNKVEELRTANSDLRDYGSEWHSYALEVENQRDILQEELETLKKNN